MLKSLLGIDIGTYAIKMVEISNPSKPRLESYFVIPLPKFRPETTPEEKISTISRLISNTIREEKIKTKHASVSLISTTGLIKFITFPQIPKEEIRTLIINEPDRYFLGTDINNLRFDVDIIGETKETGNVKVETIVVGVYKNVIQEKMEILKRAKLIPTILDIEQLAMCNMYEFNLHDPKKMETVVLVNIGALHTSLCIIENGIPRVIREFPIGGERINEDLQKSLLISYNEAEEIKIKYGLLIPKEKRMTTSVLPSIEELTKEIQKSIDFYYSMRGEYFTISELLLTGGSALLKGLLEHLQRSLGISVSILDPFARIVKKEEVPSFISPFLSVSAGLSLRLG